MARRKEPNPDEAAISKMETTDVSAPMALKILEELGINTSPKVECDTLIVPDNQALNPDRNAKVLCKPRKPHKNKLDAVKRAEYLRLMSEEGYNRTKAALAVGVSYPTVWRNEQADPAFARAISEAEMKGTRVVFDKVESALIDTALAGNVTAQKFALVSIGKYVAPDKYVDSTTVEHRVSMDQMEKARRFAVLLGVSVENVLPEGTAKGAIVDIEAEEPD